MGTAQPDTEHSPARQDGKAVSRRAHKPVPRFRPTLRHRATKLLLVGLMILFVVLVPASAAGLCYGGYRLTRAALHGWTALGFGLHAKMMLAVLAIDLAIVGVSMALLLGLFPLVFLRPDEKPPGKLLSRTEHPRLFTLIDRMSKRLDVRAPDVCLLSPFDEAFICDLVVVEREGARPRPVRALALGAGFVVHSRLDEFATIICHELAHAAAGDTRAARRIHRFYRAMQVQMGLIAGGESEPNLLDRTIARLLLGYYALFSLLHAHESRCCEYRADRVAAEVCGPQNTRNMLIKAHLIGFIPELGIESLVRELSMTESPMENVYQEHRDRWQRLSRKRREQAENEMFMQKGSVRSSHPQLAQRLRSLAGVKAPELSAPAPAAQLFEDWNQLERDITQVLVRLGRAAFRFHLKSLDRQLQRA